MLFKKKTKEEIEAKRKEQLAALKDTEAPQKAFPDTEATPQEERPLSLEEYLNLHMLAAQHEASLLHNLAQELGLLRTEVDQIKVLLAQSNKDLVKKK